MEINRHNYEAYLLDRLEGRLSVEDQQHLHDFLQSNPDCSGELSELEPWFLEPAKMHYPERILLKRKFPDASSLLTDHNFDLFSIARMEGDLTREQEEAHRKMVAEDLQKYHHWMNWQLTKLVPAEVVFNDKDRLIRRKGISRRIIWISVISAAAAVAMVIVLLRMEPVLPQHELSMQQHLDVPDQAEVQAGVRAEIAEPLQDQLVKQSPGLPEQKSNNSALVFVKKEHNRPLETESNKDLAPMDNLQPRPLRVSETKVNLSSLAGKPVSDQIEPLNVPPAPVHLSSWSVAQIYDRGLQEVLADYTKEKDISFLTVANAGIKGINRIAGSEISLLASRDEEGEVSGFRLKSKRFSLTRPLGQEE